MGTIPEKANPRGILLINKRVFLVTSIILFSFIPSIQPVKAFDEWEIWERGQDYIINHLKGTNAYSWESAPTWILNSSGEYAPYIYYRDEAKKCYTVQSGLVGFELYDAGIATFYDPDLLEERVKSERWELWHLDKTEWKQATLSSSIIFTVHQYPDSIIIEAIRFSYKPDGALLIRYIFVQGQPMKHEITWQSLGTETEIVEVRQVWDLKLSTDKVVLDNENILTTSTKTNSTTYLFGDSANDFLIRESQLSATYYPDGELRENGRFTEADIDFSGKKVTFTFGTWNLSQGETLEIDPTTSTFNNPTEDGDIRGDNPGYVRDNIDDKVYVGYSSGDNARWRGYFEWDISSIPDGSTITDTIFKYEGYKKDDGEDCHIHEMLGARPSTSSDSSVWAEIAEGTIYADPSGFVVVGTNKQVDLGSSADSDLESQLTSGDWFAIGIQRDSESSPYGWNGIRSEEYASTPDPTLYVEYTLLEEIQVQYYTVTDSRVNLDTNVNIDVHLHYTSDEAHVIDGTVTVNGISASHQGTGTWRIAQSKSSVQGINYNTVAASGNSRGISDVDQNGQSQLEIWDRYNVTSFWASSYDLKIGDNTTLYAIFESEYDYHISDGDDSITIEDLPFTYDPIEEYFFAEIGKEEAGTYYFDTLNSIYENTYNITSGNLDYNLSIAWCNYHYEFYGLYYENGTYADNVTINAYFIDNIDSFLLDHETTKNYVEQPIMFTWDLDGGGLRKFYPISNNETYYLFTPFDEYSSYSFEIKDYSGQIGSADSYLESYEVINETERMVERALIRDAANPTTLVLQKYRTYRLQIRCGTGSVYSFPHFTPAVDSPPILIIHAIEWGDQIHYVGENITVEFSRPTYTHIRINYKDEREHTTSIFVEVLLKNLTQVWNDTSTEQLIQFNWYGATNTTDYLVRLIAQHEDFGEIADSGWLSGIQPSYEDPPDESVLGDWPINNILGISMLIGTFCVFSAGTKSNLFGTFATVGVGYVLVILNFLSTPYYVLHACMVITLLWGLTLPGGRT